MKIIKTTDGQHLGKSLTPLNMGDTVTLDGFTFEVQTLVRLESGHILLSNPNYQLECEE